MIEVGSSLYRHTNNPVPIVSISTFDNESYWFMSCDVITDYVKLLAEGITDVFWFQLLNTLKIMLLMFVLSPSLFAVWLCVLCNYFSAFLYISCIFLRRLMCFCRVVGLVKSAASSFPSMC